MYIFDINFPLFQMVLTNAENQRRWRERKKKYDPNYLAKEAARVGALYVSSAELTPEARDDRNERARESAARQAAGTARPRVLAGQQVPAPEEVCKLPKFDLLIRMNCTILLLSCYNILPQLLY